MRPPTPTFASEQLPPIIFRTLRLPDQSPWLVDPQNLAHAGWGFAHNRKVPIEVVWTGNGRNHYNVGTERKVTSETIGKARVKDNKMKDKNIITIMD